VNESGVRHHAAETRSVMLVVDQRLAMHFGSRSKTKSVVAAEIAAFIAWRALAQDLRIGALVFNDVTTNASDDLERATSLARDMVTRYGMSEKMGPQTFGDKEELVFLGREISETRNYGEDVARSIDHEVRRFIDEAYARALSILTTYREKLTELANKLIEKETLDRKEFEAIFA
jgi:cell division protease FtsH